MSQRARDLSEHPGLWPGTGSVPPGQAAQQLVEVLANLLDNACRLTPAGGRVRTAVTDRGGTAEVVVTDTGPGVPVGDRERIFDRRVRLERRTDGFGLGLSIARGLARAHGGDLTCEEPADGIGAQFRLRLPVS